MILVTFKLITYANTFIRKIRKKCYIIMNHDEDNIHQHFSKPVKVYQFNFSIVSDVCKQTTLLLSGLVTISLSLKRLT